MQVLVEGLLVEKKGELANCLCPLLGHYILREHLPLTRCSSKNKCLDYNTETAAAAPANSSPWPWCSTLPITEELCRHTHAHNCMHVPTWRYMFYITILWATKQKQPPPKKTKNQNKTKLKQNKTNHLKTTGNQRPTSTFCCSLVKGP